MYIYFFKETKMITIHKTLPTNFDFLQLVNQLDAYLANKNGETNAFFVTYNQAIDLDIVVVAYLNNNPVGCGALKKLDDERMEIKRMYVDHAYRKLGIAKIILTNLEKLAQQAGYQNTVLETGVQMQPAITLYKKCGYIETDNYPPYQDIDQSVCFKKAI